MGGMPVERRATTGATGETGEEEGGGSATWVGGVGGFEILGLREFCLDDLDLFPDGERDDGFAVVFKNHAAVFEGAHVDLVAEEGGVGVVGAKEVGGLLDLVEGGTPGTHGEGLVDAGFVFWIGNPAVILALFVGAGVDGDQRFALDAPGWDAGDGSLGNDGAESVFGIDGGLAAFFFVGDVDQDLDEAAVGSFGNIVGEGVDDDLTLGAQERFVVGGIIEVTGEAGVIPEEDAVRAVIRVAGV